MTAAPPPGRCRTVEEVREATVGFDVRYEYGGREFATRMAQDPGRQLRVRIDVEPLEGRPDVPAPRPPAYSR